MSNNLLRIHQQNEDFFSVSEMSFNQLLLKDEHILTLQSIRSGCPGKGVGRDSHIKGTGMLARNLELNL